MRISSKSLFLTAAVAAVMLSACSAPVDRSTARSSGGAAAAVHTAANKKNAVDLYDQFFDQHGLSADERFVGPFTYV